MGRQWEKSAIDAMLKRAIGGRGGVVGVVGHPGIGKSRLLGELVATAAAEGVEVSTFCESHARDIPFRAVARLLRVGTEALGFEGHLTWADAMA